MPNDGELLREFVEGGSEEAFRILVERHTGMVHGAALQVVHDESVAEEVTQPVFIILARKARSLTHKPVLAGWLYRTANGACAKVFACCVNATMEARLSMNPKSKIRMTNDEIRRNTEIRMTKPPIAVPGALRHSSIGFLSSFVIRHSSFDNRFMVPMHGRKADGAFHEPPPDPSQEGECSAAPCSFPLRLRGAP